MLTAGQGWPGNKFQGRFRSFGVKVKRIWELFETSNLQEISKPFHATNNNRSCEGKQI